MARPAFKKLELFAIHGVVGEEGVDYEALFEILLDKQEALQVEKGVQVVVASEYYVDGDFVFMRVDEGDRGVFPLIVNPDTRRERLAELSERELVANCTHCAFDLGERLAAVEYNQRGAKANDIARLIEASVADEQDFEGMSFTLSPVPDGEFLQALEKFGRIQLASLKVNVPNNTWTDHYNDLSSIGAESRGRDVTLIISAMPKSSLDKRKGIIGALRTIIKQRLPYLRSAAIVGNRVGETADTRISLSKYTVHQKVKVEVDASNRARSSQMYDLLRAFLTTSRR